jgi:hypothetical protein
MKCRDCDKIEPRGCLEMLGYNTYRQNGKYNINMV